LYTKEQKVTTRWGYLTLLNPAGKIMPGVWAMSVPLIYQQLDQRLARLENEIRVLRRSLADQGLAASAYPLIECRPDVCGGEPVLTGTRTPVRAIVEHIRLGDRVEDILEHLPHLTVEQIHAALDYYRGHKQEIDVLIELNDDERFWQAWTQSAAPSSTLTRT
jgi:uncharacterized protein (DUF433 family)